MALQKTISLVNGVTLTDAYIKAKSVAGTKDNMVIELTINASHALSDQNLSVCTRNYNFVPDLESEDNVFKQAYDFLKTQDEYLNAIDV
jgi:hypothetical protein